MLGTAFSRGLAIEVHKSLAQIAARQLLGTTFLTSTSCSLSNQCRHATTTTTKVAGTRTRAKLAPTKSKSTPVKEAAPRKKPTTRTAKPKKKATTTKTATKTKAATTKTTPKRKAATTKTKLKRKAAPKEGKTTVKRKPGRKLKKKALTPDQATRLKVKSLKQTALLGSQGKRLPQTAWMVFMVDHVKKGQVAAPQLKPAAQMFKNLSPSAVERLNHTGVENKRKNAQNYQSWIAAYTVDQIKLANNARRLLIRYSKASVAAGNTRSVGPRHVTLLKDERAPKKPRAPYIVFSTERWASGDFKNVKLGEAAKLIGSEWKALSADEKKQYHESAARLVARA